MWEGQQWIFQVLPQVTHSRTICHGMVAQNLSLFSFAPPVKRAHDIDDITLTYVDLSLFWDILKTLLEHLQGK